MVLINLVLVLDKGESSPFISTPVVTSIRADLPSAEGENLAGNSRAGNISRYLENWQKITSNNFILRIIKEGYKIQFDKNPEFPNSVISNPVSETKKLALEGEIARHLKSGAISKIQSKNDQLLSRVFTVPKPNGKVRMIIDLSMLNTQINHVHFKMEGLNSVKSIIHPSDFMSSIDLSDAFFSIPIHQESRKYLCFEFSGQRYQFNVLPFGMTSSPRIFTKILKPVIIYLRNLGIKIVSYLDDIFLCASTPTILSSNIKTALKLLCDLGFYPNYNKSNLIPSKKLFHLGFNWNSYDMTLSIPKEKVTKANDSASALLNNQPTLRSISAFIGLLNSFCPAFPYAPLYFRNLQFLQIEKIQSGLPWDSLVSLDPPSITNLEWWKDCKFPLTSSPLHEIPFDVTLYTDASLSGWAGVLSTGSTVSGQWSSEESKLHINYLELKAILICFKSLTYLLENKNIQICCDNFSAVSFINKKGGTHSKLLCQLTLEFWSYLINNNITCSATHIPGSENNIADHFSRYSVSSHEYSLGKDSFDSIISLFNFRPSIDLFATRHNFKVEKFVSWQFDHLAYKTNAFSFQWPNNSYLFPPINLISKCIQKIINDKLENALLITPA